jgi:hypothetical protein
MVTPGWASIFVSALRFLATHTLTYTHTPSLCLSHSLTPYTCAHYFRADSAAASMYQNVALYFDTKILSRSSPMLSNYGVVGALDENNHLVLTQSFVHRRHQVMILKLFSHMIVVHQCGGKRSHGTDAALSWESVAQINLGQGPVENARH